MSEEEEEEVVEKLIHYKFRNKELLKTALTTPSYADLYKIESYQAFECAGDAILKVTILNRLIEEGIKQPKDLNEKKDKIESNETLSKWGFHKNLDRHIKKTKDQKVTTKIMADVIEALCYAIFIDSGNKIETVYEIIVKPLMEWTDMQVESNENSIKTHMLVSFQKKFKKSAKITCLYSESKENKKTLFGVSKIFIDIYSFDVNIPCVHTSKRSAELSALLAIENSFFHIIESPEAIQYQYMQPILA